MSILQFPQNTARPDTITCVLCGRTIGAEQATVGPVDAGGVATLLCGGHLWDGLSFINRLADYTAAERDRYFRNNIDDIIRFGGGRQDAGFVY